MIYLKKKLSSFLFKTLMIFKLNFLFFKRSNNNNNNINKNQILIIKNIKSYKSPNFEMKK